MFYPDNLSTNPTYWEEDAKNLYKFIQGTNSTDRMLASSIQFFYKAFPEAKERIRHSKLKAFCNAFSDLFIVENDGKAGITQYIDI